MSEIGTVLVRIISLHHFIHIFSLYVKWSRLVWFKNPLVPISDVRFKIDSRHGTEGNCLNTELVPYSDIDCSLLELEAQI